MLERMTKLFSQLAVCDKHKSDHDVYCSNLHPQIYGGQISQCSNFVHLLGRPSWQGKGEVQVKNAGNSAL